MAMLATPVPPPDHAAAITLLTMAATKLDAAAAAFAPAPPKKGDQPTPPPTWGDDRGTLENLEDASHGLQHGRDLFTQTFTRHQAGPLFDALDTDLTNVWDARNAAFLLSENPKANRYVAQPTFTPGLVTDLGKAAADARAAVAMLQGKLD